MEAPRVPLAAWQGERTEIDPQRNPQITAGSDTSGSACFEPAIQRDRLVLNSYRTSVFVGERQSPFMALIGKVPGNRDPDGDGDLLRPRADNAEASTENKQLASRNLNGIAHQDDGVERWGREVEVRLLHGVDPIVAYVGER